METKYCVDCEKFKNIEDFYFEGNRNNNIRKIRCKQCEIIRRKKLRQDQDYIKTLNNDEKILFAKKMYLDQKCSIKQLSQYFKCRMKQMVMALQNIEIYDLGFKYCSNPNCSIVGLQQMKQFGKDLTRSDGKQYWCKTCMAKRHIDTFSKNLQLYERMKITSRRHYLKNKEEIARKHVIWKKNNPYYELKMRARREKHSIPCWANRKKINDIYFRAKMLTKTTGILYEVDHIIPVNAKHACGLHVENNLQIITRDENRKKGNFFVPYIGIGIDV